MFPYKTNSPQYLDYVAATLSRKQIQDDPTLCLLLENEYIKDNMEMAIRYQEAKYGDYQAKYDFIEYFMANGPELDADTIMHYRGKCYNDPAMMEIAYSYFKGANIAKIREEKYGKDTDDCFKNPCFYLDKISPQMGRIGDKENTYGMFSFLSNFIKAKAGELKTALAVTEEQVKTGQITQEEADKRIEAAKKSDEENVKKQGDGNVRPDAPDNDEKNTNRVPPCGEISKSFVGLIPPSVQRGWNVFWKNGIDGLEEFAQELVDFGKANANSKRIGDWMSTKVAEIFDANAKANVKKNLGDCGRLWSQQRRLNLFNPAENTFGPINPSQVVGNTTPQGTELQPISNPKPTVNKATVTISAAHGIKTEGLKGIGDNIKNMFS